VLFQEQPELVVVRLMQLQLEAEFLVVAQLQPLLLELRLLLLAVLVFQTQHHSQSFLG